MAKKRHLIFFISAMMFLAACGSSEFTTGDASATQAETASVDDSTTVDTDSADDLEEDISDAPDSLAIADDGGDGETDAGDDTDDDTALTPDTTTTTSTTTTTTTVVVPTCTAPELHAFAVDVEDDDPDGGLNMRSGPGANNPVINTFARFKELISTGECEVVGSTDWWQVTTSDGGETGWVNSNFLADPPAVVDPVLGAVFEESNLSALGGGWSEDIADSLAARYGFPDDAQIVKLSEEGLDAQGGTATYWMNGLRDDSLVGYRFVIDYFFEKSEPNGDEILGIEPFRITRQLLCARGVTPDGLCI